MSITFLLDIYSGGKQHSSVQTCCYCLNLTDVVVCVGVNLGAVVCGCVPEFS